MTPAVETKLVTYRQYLIEQVYLESFRTGQPTNPFVVAEAVASTAIEHPEWPMNEYRSREDWVEWEKAR